MAQRSPIDIAWMTEAIALARRGEGTTRPNPPVGAVIVSETGTLAGRGYHRVAGGPHAEVMALRAAGSAARGGTLYVTLEPCSTHGRTPPCTEAIITGGIARTVIAAADPNPLHTGKGVRRLRAAGIAASVGVCRAEATRLIAPFSKWILTGKPYLTLKMGMTLDGRIADSKRRSRWITGPDSRNIVQDLRRRCDAVMVGAGTVCSDNPSLVSRASGTPDAYRVIVDSTGRTPVSSTVLTDAHVERTIIATTARCPQSRRTRYEKKGATVWVLPSADNQVSLRTLLSRLGKMGLLHVLCEGGGALAGRLVERRLVDEFAFFIAPRILGRHGVPVIAGAGNWPLKSAPRVEFTRTERVGEDILIHALPRPAGKRGGGQHP